MYVSDTIVFLHLNKTGGIHVTNALGTLVPGKMIGGRKKFPYVISRHIRAPRALLRNRFIMGGVRDPWDMYVSLWTYGCTMRGLGRHLCRREFLKSLVRNLLSPSMFLHEWHKPVGLWREAYADAGNPALFRQWLRLIFDPAHKYDLGERYGFSSIANFVGFYTYRYLRLYSQDIRPLYAPGLSSWESVTAFDREQNLLHHVIRQETLEADLLDGLRKAGVDVSPEQEAELFTVPHSNSSVRSRDLRQYYDRESIDLVGDRERLIIEKHGYVAPVLA